MFADSQEEAFVTGAFTEMARHGGAEDGEDFSGGLGMNFAGVET